MTMSKGLLGSGPLSFLPPFFFGMVRQHVGAPDVQTYADHAGLSALPTHRAAHPRKSPKGTAGAPGSSTVHRYAASSSHPHLRPLPTTAAASALSATNGSSSKKKKTRRRDVRIEEFAESCSLSLEDRVWREGREGEGEKGGASARRRLAPRCTHQMLI
jgi:hypothetical protein